MTKRKLTKKQIKNIQKLSPVVMERIMALKPVYMHVT